MSILKNKKIIIAAAIVIVVTACIVGGIFLFAGDRQEEPTLDEIIQEKLSAYQTDLLDSLESMETNDDVAAYLVNWGKNKKISTSRDSKGNVIFTIDAAEEHKDQFPSAVICGYDAENMTDYIESIAVALTVAKNSIHNCAYKVVFCPESKGEKIGIEKLSSSLFTDDTRVFYLGKSGTSKVSQITGGYRQYVLSKKLNSTVSEYDKAYRIRISGIPSEVMDSKLGGTPNAIKTLGNLLANFKSTSMLFEISGFSGGISGNMIPSSAEVDIVINSSDTAKFESKMNSAIEKFMEKYSDNYPDAVYAYEEIDVPSQVLAKTDSDNIVSLMYTVLNGVYNKDDDGNVVAITNIGEISLKDGKLNINISAMSSSQEYLDEITDSYRTISGLCNVKYECMEEYDIYDGAGIAANDELFAAFKTSFMNFTGDSEMNDENAVEFTPLTILAKKNEKMPMLYLGITEKTKEKYAGSIVTFLDKGVAEES